MKMDPQARAQSLGRGQGNPINIALLWIEAALPAGAKWSAWAKERDGMGSERQERTRQGGRVTLSLSNSKIEGGTKTRVTAARSGSGVL